ncbi:MAG TPA: fibronectin type III domain-containing protein [Clostridiaceae bacterium]|nr:fibronectin type III domain-containing protein [Clostridiaceae bacterium]
MRQIKRVIAILTLIFFLTVAYSGTLVPVWGAPNPVNITVDSYNQGELKIRWNSIPGARSVTIEYHEPDENNQAVLNSFTLVQSTNSATITNLRNNYIYDIAVKVFDNPSGNGTPIGQGILYFIPDIDFYSEQVEQAYTPLQGGGREIGDKPRLRLKWAIPMVYNGLTGSFTEAHAPEALAYMQSRINNVYGTNTQLSTLNYRINISTDFTKLNAGSAQSSVLVNYSETGYNAVLPGKENDAAEVKRIAQNNQDYLTFVLLGKSSPEDTITETGQYELPDNDILPGTVYYMNIKPIIKDDQGTQVGGIVLGSPEDLNGSGLSGEFAYTYTPIRFQITRDDTYNAYIKIFKVNHGSLDLPRLYYQVQVSDSPVTQGDWIVKKTLDDTYFSGDFALTVISDINPYNELFYKIVVKTDSSDDRLESLPMPYTLYEDTGKPPAPANILVEKVEPAVKTQDGKILKSSDVTISWSKPLNWEDIKNNNDPEEDIVYHILLNTAQTESNVQPYPPLEAEGVNYGYFPVKYRLVKYVSSKELVEKGNRLEYTIKGFELFKGSSFTGNYDSDGNPEFQEEQIANTEGYPSFLLPNKVYYFQVYTTKGVNRGTTDKIYMSEKSLTCSFTTVTGKKGEVPLVKNLKVISNTADVELDPVTGELIDISNYTEIQFETPDIIWSNYTSYLSGNKVYYDLYMSTRPEIDSFILIGSTDDFLDNGDVEWKSLLQDRVLSAKVRNFSSDSRAYTAFGDGLRPNTTYYFIVKTRLWLNTESYELESVPSVLLTVTTIKGPVKEPDEQGRRPLAPTDFAVAYNNNGDLLVSGTSVTFCWSKLENDVIYRLICTSERVLPEDDEEELQSDPLYRYFNLNPQEDIAEGYFEYIDSDNEYRLTINEGLYPNRIYYFSLKAIKVSDGSESYWVSIPVTTTLIDSPVSIEIINDYQLGFFWKHDNSDSGLGDFTVYIRSSTDYSYKLVDKTQYSFVKDGEYYYGRVGGLKPNTSYSVKVVKSQGGATVYEKSGLTTRDGYHQIDVRWTGHMGYEYELAIKSENQDEYVILQNSDLMEFTNANGARKPYYIEGTGKSTSSGYYNYYARIKTAPVTLPNGEVRALPLKSNTKYYVKVRAVKADPSNLEIVAKSRYAGPASTRTEYSQDDYEDDLKEDEYKDLLLKRVKEIEKKYYWKFAETNNIEKSLLLKEDRVVSTIQNTSDLTFDIDALYENTYSNTVDSSDSGIDVIYIPLGVLEEMNRSNKGINIKVSGSEYFLKPGFIDINAQNGIKKLLNSVGVKDILVKVIITRINGQVRGLPYNTSPLSKINTLTVHAIGISKTQKEIKELVNDRLYNENTGIVNLMLNFLLQYVSGLGTEAEKFVDGIINSFVDIIEAEIGAYVAATLDLLKPYNRYPYTQYQEISNFEKNISVKLYHTERAENVAPYKLHTVNKRDSWNELPLLSKTSGYIVFETAGTGSFIAAQKKDMGNNVSEKVSLERKWENIGLGEDISFGNIYGKVTREKLAAILIDFFCRRTGTDLNRLRPGKNIYISDEENIGKKYYKSVLMAIEYDILKLKKGNMFEPNTTVDNLELDKALDRLQELLE